MWRQIGGLSIDCIHGWHVCDDGPVAEIGELLHLFVDQLEVYLLFLVPAGSRCG